VEKTDFSRLHWLLRAFVFGALGLLAVTILVVQLAQRHEAEPKASAKEVAPASAPASAAADPLAPERAAFMRKLVDVGVASRVEMHGDFVQLWVRSPFFLADFEQKQKVAVAVFRHCRDVQPACKFVVITDAKSGKDVGSFDMQVGLRID
jgi:hypothetical protein